MKKKAKRPIIIWGEVWDDFNTWYESVNRKCQECRHTLDAPEWDEQMAKIEELVEKRLDRASNKNDR